MIEQGHIEQTYEQWEKERQALWDKYKTHYLRARGGDPASVPYIYEHALQEKGLTIDYLQQAGELDDEQLSTCMDVEAMASNIMEELLHEDKMPLSAVNSDVKCRRCNRKARGYKIYMDLPTLGKHLHEEVCVTCK